VSAGRHGGGHERRRQAGLGHDQSLRTASLLIGKGDGTFAPSLDYIIGVRSTSAALSDLNRDGRLDLVARSSARTVAVLLSACR
jgi:hypothetical protein